jgi:hypothetical protein
VQPKSFAPASEIIRAYGSDDFALQPILMDFRGAHGLRGKKDASIFFGVGYQLPDYLLNWHWNNVPTFLQIALTMACYRCLLFLSSGCGFRSACRPWTVQHQLVLKKFK